MKPGLRSLLLLAALVAFAADSLLAQNFQVIYSFPGGNSPANINAPLIRDPAGNLYGTSSAGGNSGQGTVFKLAPTVP